MTRAVRRNVIAQCVGCWTSEADIRWVIDHSDRVSAADDDGETYNIISMHLVGNGLSFDAVMPSTGRHTHRYSWMMKIAVNQDELTDSIFGVRWKMKGRLPIAGVDTYDDEDVQIDRIALRKDGCYFESWTESTRMALKHWMNHTADGTDYRAYHVERLWRC